MRLVAPSKTTAECQARRLVTARLQDTKRFRPEARKARHREIKGEKGVLCEPYLGERWAQVATKEYQARTLPGPTLLGFTSWDFGKLRD